MKGVLKIKIIKFGQKGSEIMEIQALLKKIGYNPGPIDGVFGTKTKLAVKQFQKENGLTSDGIIGPKTYRKIMPILLGYDYYVIKPNDTIYKIARMYYTSINKILTANPNVNPNNLQIGNLIIVPYGIDIVDTNISYTYEIMKHDINGLKARYPFLSIGSAGKSVLGKELYYIKIGNGPNKVFYNGSHHALEWITSSLLMKYIENFCKALSENKKINNYYPSDIIKQSTIYIIPMVNPDGIDLVINGLDKNNPYYNNLLKWNNTGLPFSKVWNANIKGVDLNHNYNASWEESKTAEKELGIYGPGPTRYSGNAPESEPESKAIANFTRLNNFRLVLAYHSQGEIIYWNYKNLATFEAKRIGDLLSNVSGYDLAEAYGITSYAGYKDWFIKEYNRPGYTIEVGKGKNPLPLNQFNKIYDDNEELLLLASII